MWFSRWTGTAPSADAQAEAKGDTYHAPAAERSGERNPFTKKAKEAEEKHRTAEERLAALAGNCSLWICLATVKLMDVFYLAHLVALFVVLGLNRDDATNNPDCLRRQLILVVPTIAHHLIALTLLANARHDQWLADQAKTSGSPRPTPVADPNESVCEAIMCNWVLWMWVFRIGLIVVCLIASLALTVDAAALCSSARVWQCAKAFPIAMALALGICTVTLIGGCQLSRFSARKQPPADTHASAGTDAV